MRHHRDKQAGDFVDRPHLTIWPHGLGPKRGVLSCTVTSGDFPARIRNSRAIIRLLLEHTAEPMQAEPDTSSAGRFLERRSPSVHQRS
jgi:hypothetical protein